MIGILLAKVKGFIRNPWTFLLFTGMSIFFAFIFGATSGDKPSIPVHATNESIRDSYIGQQLNNHEVFRFNWMTVDNMLEKIEQGKAELGVILMEDDFQIIVGVDSYNTDLVQQTMTKVYREEMERNQLLNIATNLPTLDEKRILHELDSAMEKPIFQVESSSYRGDGAFIYDNSLHRIFGFSLFFVIYTIAYNVLPILIEKRDGIWDRMILSPLKKSEMYVANLIYSFITGYIQVVIIFSMFRFGLGVDFYGNFVETLLLLIPYVFTIVALSIFLSAVVKNVQQFSAALPLLAISMAMIGGAYWPIEIVESKILLLLAKINPLTYGLELLQGATVYGYGLEELLFPLSILVLMGVILMGLGIHLMERRHI